MVMDIISDRIDVESVRQFSEKDKAYMLQEDRLESFWKYPMNMDAFEAVIEERKKYKTDRVLLKTVLEDQYQSLGFKFENRFSIEDDNTFTITTAHQPSLMTGPLYFIYKAVSSIKLSRNLKEKYPDYNFMPVFVIGGEDHDFEEINHFRIFGKTLVWDNQGQNGACGRMSLKGMNEVLNQTKEILGSSEHASNLSKMLDNAFGDDTLTYGQATQKFVIELFQNTELTVFSMDDEKLKKAFIPILKKELLEEFSKPLVEQTVADLSSIGLKMQAFPRAINLFYLSEAGRNRIEKNGDVYHILNTELQFTEAELLEELENNPAAFSPNVVLRPLYQEHILPNLAYVGGGGELSYWLERKSQFEAAGLSYPMLVRRDSVLWFDSNSQNKWAKLGLKQEDWFTEMETLKKAYVLSNSTNEISLTEELEAFNDIINTIAGKTESVDKSLVGKIEAEGARIRKSLEGIEKRLQKTEKQKFSQAISQIEKLKERFFPNDGLQERKDNFMAIYLKHGPEFIDVLIDIQDPMKTGLKLVTA